MGIIGGREGEQSGEMKRVNNSPHVQMVVVVFGLEKSF
jgi:hypothetical protein